MPCTAVQARYRAFQTALPGRISRARRVGFPNRERTYALRQDAVRQRAKITVMAAFESLVA